MRKLNMRALRPTPALVIAFVALFASCTLVATLAVPGRGLELHDFLCIAAACYLRVLVPL